MISENFELMHFPASEHPISGREWRLLIGMPTANPVSDSRIFPHVYVQVKLKDFVISGRGSWNRRKAIINPALRDEQRLSDLMRKLRRKLGELAAQLETQALALAEAHLNTIDSTLDMVRSEHVALESERDPEFRGRVRNEVDALNEAMERILTTVGNV